MKTFKEFLNEANTNKNDIGNIIKTAKANGINLLSHPKDEALDAVIGKHAVQILVKDFNENGFIVYTLFKEAGGYKQEKHPPIFKDIKSAKLEMGL